MAPPPGGCSGSYRRGTGDGRCSSNNSPHADTVAAAISSYSEKPAVSMVKGSQRDMFIEHQFLVSPALLGGRRCSEVAAAKVLRLTQEYPCLQTFLQFSPSRSCSFGVYEGGRSGFSRKQVNRKEPHFIPDMLCTSSLMPVLRADWTIHYTCQEGRKDNLTASCPPPRFNTLQDSLHICYIATFGVLTFIIPQGHKNVLPFTEYTELLGPPTHRHLKGPQ